MVSQSLMTRMNKIIQGGLSLPTARQKHFSFLVRRNKIVSVGWCQSFKTHPMAAKYGHRFNSIHSELHCIKNFPFPLVRLEEHTLINVRVNPTGSHMMLAKPCAKCIYFLSCFNLHEVLYTNENGEFVEL